MKEKKVSGSKKHMLFSLFFFLFILLFFVITWHNSPYYYTFDTEQVYPITTTWHNSIDSSTTETLPYKYPTDPHRTTNVYTTLPDVSDPYANTLCFRASQSLVKIWIDGTLLYSDEDYYIWKPLLGKSPGSHWVFTSLPSDYSGMELRIEMSSPYEKYQGHLNSVYLGTKAAHMYQILYTFGDDIAIGFVILLLSIALLLFHITYISRKLRNRQLLYIGLFGVLIGFWFIGESQMLQFFAGHLSFWYLLTMSALPLMPLPLLKLVENLPDFPYKRACSFARNLIMLYFLVLILLQTFEIRDFMEMQNTTLFILVIFSIVFPILIYWDFFINGNKKIFSMALALAALCIFAIFELLRGMTTLQNQLGDILRLGIFFFYLVISIYNIRQSVALYDASKQSAYYKELSYTDQMTGCQNRSAFTERENAWIFGEKDAILMADLNHLKYVNDTLGHHAGDAYIIACAQAMLEVFGDKGTCYRIGGDEFLFWGNRIDEEELQRLSNHFASIVQEKCADISPFCHIAIGIAFSEMGDHSFAEILKRADERMYVNKHFLKETLT